MIVTIITKPFLDPTEKTGAHIRAHTHAHTQAGIHTRASTRGRERAREQSRNVTMAETYLTIGNCFCQIHSPMAHNVA